MLFFEFGVFCLRIHNVHFTKVDTFIKIMANVSLVYHTVSVILLYHIIRVLIVG